MKHKRDDGAEKQDEEAVDVTPIMICVFVVMCCIKKKSFSTLQKIKRVAVGEKRERCVKLESFLSRRLKRWDLPGMWRRCFASTFTQVYGT